MVPKLVYVAVSNSDEQEQSKDIIISIERILQKQGFAKYTDSK